MTQLYILCGLPFSGKSTLAKELVSKFAFMRIDLDEIKFEMFGQEINDEDIDQSGWDKIYKEMYKRIEIALKQGQTVVHDTGNFTKHERKIIRQIADKYGVSTVTIFVDTPENICRERLLKNRQTKERFDVSDNSFEDTVSELEIPQKDENTILFNTHDSLEAWINEHIHNN